jgi:hypothetical protein
VAPATGGDGAVGLRWPSGRDEPVVCIPTPWEAGLCPRHPEVKSIVQEKFGKYRANHSALRVAYGIDIALVKALGEEEVARLLSEILEKEK